MSYLFLFENNLPSKMQITTRFNNVKAFFQQNFRKVFNNKKIILLYFSQIISILLKNIKLHYQYKSLE